MTKQKTKTEKILERIQELERRALYNRDKWDDQPLTDWLDDEEQEEYKKLKKEYNKIEVKKSPTTKDIKKYIIEQDKKGENISIENLIGYFNISQEEINKLIKPLLEEGFIFEIKPQEFRKL